MNLFEKVFGTYSERELKRIKPIAQSVMDLESEIQKLSDEQLRQKTQEFKKRLSDGETLDDILIEAFAVMREAAFRVLGMKHFYVQVIGGIILHQGRIAEMKTGEGKTLMSTLPAYLNALSGKGVHIVTVNDYLAKRDSEWMGKVYRFLGLTVGLIVHDMDNPAKKAAYEADITYGTNNELGFDYLRDNMVIYKEQMVQRGHNYAIVDEVDSILIDEARTPLIISGMGNASSDLYKLADMFVKRLTKLVVTEHDDKQLDEDVEADYIVDEKASTATLTDKGIKKAEQGFGIENLSDPSNMSLQHHINQALRANGCMHRDKQYVIKDGEVLIVDEFTGRTMPGRRYSDGLHQAIEAKEGVKIENESKTLATITFQNYFRLYSKLSGMTGTALTEEQEFQHIYNLDVVVIPTNRPVVREDFQDVVYKSEQGKFMAVIEQIKECNAKGQPVLVGTVNIHKSELLSALLKRQGIKHEVLNAKFHEKEAEIVAQAGKKNAVTIATNMAGRGTDIILGGNPEYMAKRELLKRGFPEEIIVEATGFADTDNEQIIDARKQYNELYNQYKNELADDINAVKEAGGLFIIGTERHESRRIDNQLRGRAGRQGDPGASKFFLSLEDDLMRIFGSQKVKGMIDALGLEEDQPIEARMLTGAIENAQKNLEGRNFDTRKHVLQYDEVLNTQRKIIYKERQRVLDGEDMKANIIAMFDSVANEAFENFIGVTESSSDWNINALKEFADTVLGANGAFDVSEDELSSIKKEEVLERLIAIANQRHKEQEEAFGEQIRELERVIMLQVIDTRWMDHIDEMEHVKQEIGLRAYAQHDPVVEYRQTASEMYDAMLDTIKRDTVKYVLNAKITQRIEREQVAKPLDTGSDGSIPKQPKKAGEKIGRNDTCPCGSGQKYKNCCGR